MRPPPFQALSGQLPSSPESKRQRFGDRTNGCERRGAVTGALNASRAGPSRSCRAMIVSYRSVSAWRASAADRARFSRRRRSWFGTRRGHQQNSAYEPRRETNPPHLLAALRKFLTGSGSTTSGPPGCLVISSFRSSTSSTCAGTARGEDDGMWSEPRSAGGVWAGSTLRQSWLRSPSRCA